MITRNQRRHDRTAAFTVAALLIILLLSGCVAVGPDYSRPEIPMPTGWSSRTAGPALTEADKQALTEWWTYFEDPVLTKLMERAVTGNLDLKEAAAKVLEVRLQRRVTSANLMPDLSATGKGSVTRSQDEFENWKNRESYGTGLDVSWELDLFGGTRREMEAALADFQAAEEDYRDVMVSLTAETASSYVLLRTYQKRLEVARENLRLQTEAAELTKIKYQTGLAGALDLEQATYGLESTRSQIPGLEASIGEMKNRLAVLVGGWPGELNTELSTRSTIPRATPATPIGVPADLIRRRPDIRGAERRLAAQTARIGAAEADLYPKLTLSGSLGWESATLGSLISPAHMAAALASGISWNVFNGGAIRANIGVQNAKQEQALVQYEATLRTAVEEVENALTGLVKETQKQEALAKAVMAAREAAVLALQEYENGLSDFQKVLETQQSLMSYQDKMTESRGQAALNLITLYKALGGGWCEGRSPHQSP